LRFSASTIIICIWAFWGIKENFHEGWHYESLLSNLGLMFMQYLGLMLILMGVTLVSTLSHSFQLCGPDSALACMCSWPCLLSGSFEHFLMPPPFLLIAPLVGIGSLYWFGRPQPRKIAVALAAGLPVLTLIVAGIEPVIRVSQRFNDGDPGARRVLGNGVDLI
jgi:hypothetical protein